MVFLHNRYFTRKYPIKQPNILCQGWDLNPQVLRHTVLSDACIPISTPWQGVLLLMIVYQFHLLAIAKAIAFAGGTPWLNCYILPNLSQI